MFLLQVYLDMLLKLNYLPKIMTASASCLNARR